MSNFEDHMYAAYQNMTERDSNNEDDNPKRTSLARKIGAGVVASAVAGGGLAGIMLISSAQRESFNENQQDPNAPAVMQEIPSQEDYDNGLVDTSIYSDGTPSTEVVGAVPDQINVYFDESVDSIPVRQG